MKDKDGVWISNNVLNDEDLSIEAKGLYLVIACELARDETLNKECLRKKIKLGVTKFDRIWRELKQAGYLIQKRLFLGNDRIAYEYELNCARAKSKD